MLLVINIKIKLHMIENYVCRIRCFKMHIRNSYWDCDKCGKLCRLCRPMNLGFVYYCYFCRSTLCVHHYIEHEIYNSYRAQLFFPPLQCNNTEISLYKHSVVSKTMLRYLQHWSTKELRITVYFRPKSEWDV